MTATPDFRAILPGLVPARNVQPAPAVACRAVRPLFFLHHRPMAEAAEVLAASFSRTAPLPALAGLGVLKDLAWVAALLRDERDRTAALEPTREALVAFLHRQAPSKAEDWLRVSVADEPLRWSFRLAVAPELGDMLTRLLRTVFAFGDLLDALGRERGATAPAEELANLTAAVARAEIEWAICQGPAWKTHLLAIRSILPEVEGTP